MNDIKDITKELEQGVKALFDGERYKEYLSFMAKFHTYSAANTVLIWIQKPDASLIAGYQTWAKKFGRNVRKGEKGIKIIAPCPHKFVKQEQDEDGNVTEKEIRYNSYKAVTVFDVSQTEGKEVPEICKTLSGDVEDFESLKNRLEEISPVPITIEEIETGANGYFHPKENRIVVKKGLPEQQTIKTMIHEISHSILHCEDGEEKDADRATKEVTAESIAYTVCTALGIDASDYSFGYLAGWSSGKELKELQNSIDVIRKTASEIIEKLTA